MPRRGVISESDFDAFGSSGVRIIGPFRVNFNSGLGQISEGWTYLYTGGIDLADLPANSILLRAWAEPVEVWDNTHVDDKFLIGLGEGGANVFSAVVAYAISSLNPSSIVVKEVEGVETQFYYAEVARDDDFLVSLGNAKSPAIGRAIIDAHLVCGYQPDSSTPYNISPDGIGPHTQGALDVYALVASLS